MSFAESFFAPEAFNSKHSSKATLNLLKQNLFIRELGWRSEIIIIGDYLQQEDEKEWYSVVISGMYFIASYQNTADRKKIAIFMQVCILCCDETSIYIFPQWNQLLIFPSIFRNEGKGELLGKLSLRFLVTRYYHSLSLFQFEIKETILWFIFGM